MSTLSASTTSSPVHNTKTRGCAVAFDEILGILSLELLLSEDNLLNVDASVFDDERRNRALVIIRCERRIKINANNIILNAQIAKKPKTLTNIDTHI